jgi:hypothetical protein
VTADVKVTVISSSRAQKVTTHRRIGKGGVLYPSGIPCGSVPGARFPAAARVTSGGAI